VVDDRSKILRRLVDQWVEEADGWFRTDDIWKQYNVQTEPGKNAVWQRLKELVKTGIVEKGGMRYRRIEQEAEDIDIFQEANFVSIKFPFALEDFVRMSEKSVMVIAGDVDAGKTALLLNIAIMNMKDWDVWCWNSETGVALLKERLFAIEPNLPNPLPFHLKWRMDNFADVIRLNPNGLHIVDYLDIDSEMYMVGAEIKKILKALDKGVAIIGLQKPEGRDLGYGGTFSIKKAEVYISMSKDRLKIVKAKSRANPTVNPINKQWSFRIDNSGSNFLDVQEAWY